MDDFESSELESLAPIELIIPNSGFHQVAAKFGMATANEIPLLFVSTTLRCLVHACISPGRKSTAVYVESLKKLLSRT